MSDVGKLGLTDNRLIAFTCGPIFVSMVNREITPDFIRLETLRRIAASDRFTSFATSTKDFRASSFRMSSNCSSI